MAILTDEAKQLIKDSIDVESLVRALGFKVSRSTSSEVRAPCIIHGGDNPTAFSVHLESKKWKCFTKKCEIDGTGRSDNDLIALVRRVTGRSFMEAIEYLAEFSGLHLNRETMFVSDTEEHRRRSDIKKYVKAVSRITKDKSLPDINEAQVLEFVLQRDGYFLDKGFLSETLEEFEVGSMVDRHGTPRATIPIRDSGGQLVGLSARRTDSDEDPRYLVEYEFQKGRVLYNMDRALKAGSDTIILVEGFKGLWSVWEAGFKNVVAAMGANLSKEQALVMCASGFTNCLVAFDGDAAGVAGADLVQPKLEGAFNLTRLTFPDGKSPDDFNRKELKELINIYLETL